MVPGKKDLRVLIIPDLFPLYEGDLRGIFLLDYISAISNNFRVIVFASKLTAGRTGYSVEQKENYELHRYALVKHLKLKFLKPLAYIFWLVKSYFNLNKLDNIDIVHTHGTLLSGTLGWLYSRRRKIPLIITEHQGPFSVISSSRVKLFWAKFILQKADLVLTVSDHLRKEIFNCRINPKRILVSHNPVNDRIFNMNGKSVSNSGMFVFAGRLDKFKGASRCVEAFSGIYKKYTGWKFIIIGEGEDKPSIEQVITLNADLKEKIILKGFLDKEEIAGVLRMADFFVFPSLHESFGLVIAEAMACGLPVIAPDCTAPPEFVNMDSGILVDPADVDKICSAIEFMIMNHDKFNREEISRRIIERFGLKAFGDQMTSIYNSVLN